jgi:ABC-type branched-subunit amino acid transport system substrate-binding protein
LVKNPGWTFTFGILYEQSFGGFIDYQLKHWKEKRPIRVAYYTLNTVGGREPFKVNPWLESRGVKVVATEFTQPVPVDITKIMMRFQQTKPDFIYGICPVTAFAKLITELKKRNLKSKVIFPSFVPFSETLKYVDKAAMEGHYSASGYNTYLDVASPQIKLMNELFKKHIPEMMPPNTKDMWTWGHIVVAKSVLEMTYDKMGSWDKITGETVYEVMNEGGKIPTGGITSDLTFSPTKRIGNNAFKILQCRDGKPADVAGWLPFPKGLSEGELFNR